jgi:hypothetical protein
VTAGVQDAAFDHLARMTNEPDLLEVIDALRRANGASKRSPGRSVADEHAGR